MKLGMNLKKRRKKRDEMGEHKRLSLCSHKEDKERRRKEHGERVGGSK